MSALGQKQTLRLARSMSALPPKADIGRETSRDGLVGDTRRSEKPAIAYCCGYVKVKDSENSSHQAGTPVSLST